MFHIYVSRLRINHNLANDWGYIDRPDAVAALGVPTFNPALVAVLVGPVPFDPQNANPDITSDTAITAQRNTTPPPLPLPLPLAMAFGGG